MVGYVLRDYLVDDMFVDLWVKVIVLCDVNNKVGVLFIFDVVGID